MNILKIKDQSYPAILREIYEPPKQLYYKGEISLLKTTCIAIVGTRKNSQYGEYLTKKIIEELSIADITIVSGLAKGIDAIAHEKALKLNMPTIAILGSGINKIYPKSNLKLATEIGQKGLLISEYEPETEPSKSSFPQRNRIISGLSIATIVIEAPEKSGALITARLALEQGREIFVTPGDVDRENSQGILRLLQKGGAFPISSGREIIDILNLKEKTKKKKLPSQNKIKYKLTDEERKILDLLLKTRGRTMDYMKEKTTLSTSQILTALSFLEIESLICVKDGKYFLNC